MLAASVSKKERIGMSAPGVSLDTRSDQLPSLAGAAHGKGSRFLTSSVHVSHGFGATPGAQVGGGSYSVKAGSRPGRTGTGGSIGNPAAMAGLHKSVEKTDKMGKTMY